MAGSTGFNSRKSHHLLGIEQLPRVWSLQEEDNATRSNSGFRRGGGGLRWEEGETRGRFEGIKSSFITCWLLVAPSDDPDLLAAVSSPLRGVVSSQSEEMRPLISVMEGLTCSIDELVATIGPSESLVIHLKYTKVSTWWYVMLLLVLISHITAICTYDIQHHTLIILANIYLG
jgi:hypothetical protein